MATSADFVDEMLGTLHKRIRQRMQLAVDQLVNVVLILYLFWHTGGSWVFLLGVLGVGTLVNLGFRKWLERR